MGRGRDPVHGHFERVAGTSSMKCNHCASLVKWTNLKRAWGHFSGNKVGSAWEDGCSNASEDLRTEARRRVEGYTESAAKRSTRAPLKNKKDLANSASPSPSKPNHKEATAEGTALDDTGNKDVPKTGSSRLKKAISLLQDANNSVESSRLNIKKTQGNSNRSVSAIPVANKDAPSAVSGLNDESDSSTTEPPTPPKQPPKQKSSVPVSTKASKATPSKPVTPAPRPPKRKASRPDSAKASIQDMSPSGDVPTVPRSKRKQAQSSTAKMSANGSSESDDTPSVPQSKRKKSSVGITKAASDKLPVSDEAVAGVSSKRKQSKSEASSSSKSGNKRAKRTSGPSSTEKLSTSLWKGVLCSTGLAEGQRVLLNGVAGVHKTLVKDDFDKRVTHMIINATRPEDKPTRTMKLCKAIAAGLDLVCFKWVEDSAGSSGAWKNVKDYIHPWTKKGSNPLFHPMHFYFGNFGDKYEDKEEYVAIVKLGGGEVLTMKPNLSSSLPAFSKLYLVEVGSKKGTSRSGRRVSLSSLAEAIPGAEVVEPGWILDQCTARAG